MDLKTAPFVQKMVEDIPEDLRDLFIPKTEDELLQLECQLVRLGKKEDIRTQVMRLQKKFNLPLRPNMSLKDVGVRIRIELLRAAIRIRRGINEVE